MTQDNMPELNRMMAELEKACEANDHKLIRERLEALRRYRHNTAKYGRVESPQEE